MIRGGRGQGPVDDVDYRGARAAVATPEVRGALDRARAIVIGPSNPIVSIGPILAVPGMCQALRASAAPVVAVSPFVGGTVIKGPTEVFMDWAGQPTRAPASPPSTTDVIDGLVADEDSSRASAPRPTSSWTMPPARTRVAQATLTSRSRWADSVRWPCGRSPSSRSRAFLRPSSACVRGLEPQQREDLVQAMFRDVLAALASTALDGMVVVTASPRARAIALRHGAQVVEDREAGHNAAALLGVQAALAQGAERVLLVPGDCPAMRPEEVGGLLDHPVSAPSVLIVPDRHGTGTNALLITPPDALAPSFGPGSCQRHLELAWAAGAQAEVVEVPSLALDIDTPEDLDAFAATLDRAGSTRALLQTC